MKLTAETIDNVLPQTQCGLCGFNGCMPYAESLVNETAAINLCPPGGVEGLQKIAALLQKDPTPYIADMQQKSKPPMVALIREAECIGCAKCIKACPVDAIIGTGKRMHTVITDECTGCELCIAPCPVDCIDMIPTDRDIKSRANHFRQRYQARNKRLAKPQEKIASPKESTPSLQDKKHYIQAALMRAKQKKQS